MTRHQIPQVVLLAGGAGTRLKTAVPDLPKCLAPVHGRPFLAYVLDLLVQQRVSRLHLCLGVGSQHVLRYLSTDAPAGLEITTSVEPLPQGTAGCLRSARPYLEELFVVLLGDTYTAVDLEDLVRRFTNTGVEAGMTVLRGGDERVPSNVDVESGLVVTYEKGNSSRPLTHVDYGITVLRRESLARLPDAAAVDLAELYRSLIRDGELAALEVEEPFHEIGTPAALDDFRSLVSNRTLPKTLWRPAHPYFGVRSRESDAPKRPLVTKEVFNSPWMCVREDVVRLDDGRVENFGVVSRSDFVVIVCDVGSDPTEYLMVEQYRYAAGRWSLELPQGAIQHGESPEDAAIREFREETGWHADEPTLLAEGLHEAGDWATQQFAVVHLTARRFVGSALDADELGLTARTVAAGRIGSFVASGEIHDAATLAAFYLVDRKQVEEYQT